jgi:hypothetical protein
VHCSRHSLGDERAAAGSTSSKSGNCPSRAATSRSLAVLATITALEQAYSAWTSRAKPCTTRLTYSQSRRVADLLSMTSSGRAQIRQAAMRGSSTLTKCVALLALLVSVVSCNAKPNRAAGTVKTGHALSDQSQQAAGILGLNATKPGLTYAFSFPLLVNVSKEPLIVTSAHFSSVPAGLAVAGYRKVTATKASGYPLAMRTDIYTSVPAPRIYQGEISIRPGEQSLHFFQGLVRIDRPTVRPITGCVVIYNQGRQSYSQVLTCEFSLQP